MAEQERAIRTRNKILMATADAINEFSYEKATISDIARRAGTTPGAVYFHFSNKEAVAHAVIDTQNAVSQKKAQATVAAGYCALEVMLRVSADLMYDIIDDPLTRAGIRLTTEIHILDTPPTRSWNDWIEFNVALIRVAREEGDLKPDIDVDDVAQVLTSSIAGVHILSSLLEDFPGLAHRARALWRQFVEANASPEKVPHWISRTDALFARPERIAP
ncbi:ScbR family autoregulator-binding transcription factor [Agromyces silvae]|uniref:ScbR family autoregulator-binding transcription factor n=1 Tax=Agromyces silvae TaxID=3388266 RepID=UPI00280B87C8|nr:ScbR family autoregulator-binding transcription factor [Agromyces protaetiae]